MVSLYKREALLAEGKAAALVLLVLHVFAFVVMMSYRLHTQRYYLSQAAISKEWVSQLSESEDSGTLPKQKSGTPVNSPLERFEEPMQQLIRRLEKGQGSVGPKREKTAQLVKTTRKLTQKLKSLESPTEKDAGSDESDDHDETSQSALPNWRKLVSVGSLKDIPTKELATIFGNATKEIQEIVGTKREKKLMKQFILDTAAGSSIVKEPSKFVCPDLSTDSGDDDDDDLNETKKLLKDAAYKEDLKDYLEKFDAIFANRVQAKGIEALLPESVKKIETEMEEQLETIFDTIAGFADTLEDQLEEFESDDSEQTEKKLSSSCINRELVTAVMEAGLNAQITNSDVREALRKTILALDTKTSENDLILDADLKPKGRNLGSVNSGPVIKSINIRSLVDTPLLMKSIGWIDMLVDAIGGYNDELDSYLDSLASFHGTTSVGEIVVEKLLDEAGRMGELDAQKYLKKLQDVVGK